MITYQRCPVCDSQAIHEVLSVTDHTVSFEVFPVLQCAGCSLRFTQNVPSELQIGKYYRSDNYISHSETRKGIINWLYLQVRKYTLAVKRRFIQEQTGKKKGTILDIGAGAGAFLHHMQRHGWHTEGVEPDEGAISRARSEYKLDLKPSSHLFSFASQSFDVITMWHVLEHVHRLHEYIDHLKKICRTGGKIFVAVPNYTSADADYYQASWAAYDVPRHLYHFSPAAMHELARRHSCIIEKIQPMWFDSFYVSLLSEKYKGAKSILLNGFWQGLKSNVKAISNRRKASSIIYVITPVDHFPA
jgi:2-polyprenyl-3-methyl-5-hydroxy-6-metoxy-1,4-benzoquinol methylase